MNLMMVKPLLRAVLTVGLLCAVLGLNGRLQASLPPLELPSIEPAAQPYTWRSVAIGGGGFVPGIVFHPKQRGLIYCRTDIGGAYRWDDKEQRWIPLQDWVSRDDWNLMGIDGIGLDPNDPQRVYLAAGTYTNNWAGNGEVLRSADQGKTWQRAKVPFKFGGNENGRSMGERLVVDPHRGEVLFLGTRHNGLWRSEDRAETWKPVESFTAIPAGNNGGVGFIVIDQQSGQPGQATPGIYVGTADSKAPLWHSADGGTTWHEVAGQPRGMIPHHGVLASDGTLYLTYSNGPGPNDVTNGAVWKLDTKAGQWTDITPINPGGSGAGNFGYAGLSIDAAHPGTLLVSSLDKWSTGDDIFRSIDGGKNWTSLKAKATRNSSLSPFLNWGKKEADLGHWIGAVQIDPFDADHALYGTGATIWRTRDLTAADKGQPTHWTVGTQGLEETAILDLISPPEGAHLISGLGDIDGFRHDDFAVSPPMWTNPIMSNTDSLDFAQKNPAIVVRAGRGRGTLGAFSLDGAKSWSPFPSEPVRNGSASAAVSADGSVFLWSPQRGAPIFSSDRGKTWTRCKGAPNGLQIATDRVNAALAYGIDAGTGTGYVSTDSGLSFSPAARGLPAGRRLRLRASPDREGELYVSAEGSGLYHSTDGGKAFEKVPSIAEVAALGLGKAAPGQKSMALYAIGRLTPGGLHGVFRSDDGGASWVRINDDQHQYGNIGQTIAGDPRIFGRVYVGTNGRGILYAEPVSR